MYNYGTKEHNITLLSEEYNKSTVFFEQLLHSMENSVIKAMASGPSFRMIFTSSRGLDVCRLLEYTGRTDELRKNGVYIQMTYDCMLVYTKYKDGKTSRCITEDIDDHVLGASKSIFKNYVVACLERGVERYTLNSELSSEDSILKCIENFWEVRVIESNINCTVDYKVKLREDYVNNDYVYNEEYFFERIKSLYFNFVQVVKDYFDINLKLYTNEYIDSLNYSTEITGLNAIEYNNKLIHNSRLKFIRKDMSPSMVKYLVDTMERDSYLSPFFLDKDDKYLIGNFLHICNIFTCLGYTGTLRELLLIERWREEVMYNSKRRVPKEVLYLLFLAGTYVRILENMGRIEEVRDILNDNSSNDWVIEHPYMYRKSRRVQKEEEYIDYTLQHFVQSIDVLFVKEDVELRKSREYVDPGIAFGEMMDKISAKNKELKNANL